MSEISFPEGFLWGSATSAHQVEGGNIHSDWWAWEEAGRVKDRSGKACDHYRRFAEDFDLSAELGHKAHRFSIEWSRIEPIEGRWNEEALAHYVEVVRALRSRGLEPIVTLHHFTNPQWFLKSGGWVESSSVERFARYVRKMIEALGRSVRYWITINEPMVYIRMHYIQGLGPPGSKDIRQALSVLHHLIRAHAAAYHLLHEAAAAEGPAPQVSLAHHVPAFRPCRAWFPMDRWVSRLTDRAFNWALLEAVTEGRWSVPGVATWSIPEARETLDYFGLNYYGRQFLHWTPRSKTWPGDTCDLGHHRREVPERTSLGWDVCPEAFFQILKHIGSLRRPILITENGTYMSDDARRWRFIERHLQALARAREAGANIIGYCYWSLLDNFEWADGYTPRFGIIEVDYATQKRAVRESGRRYAQICRSNRITLETQAPGFGMESC